jgi:hypothetical protein
MAKILSDFINKTDNTSYAGTKATTTLVLPWEANCSTIFSASCFTEAAHERTKTLTTFCHGS